MTVTAAMVKELRELTDAPMMDCKKALQETHGDVQKAVDFLRKQGIAKAAKRAGKTAAEGRVAIAVSEDGRKAFLLEVNSETDFVGRDENFIHYVNEVVACGLAHGAQDLAQLMKLTLSNGTTVEQACQQLITKVGENVHLRRAMFLESTHPIGHYCHNNHRIGVLVSLDQSNAELSKDLAMHIAAFRPEAISPEDVSKTLIDKERDIFIAQAEQSGKPRDIIEKMVGGRIQKFLKEVSLLGQGFLKNPDQNVESVLKQHGTNVVSFVRFEVGEGIEKETQNFANEVMAQVEGK